MHRKTKELLNNKNIIALFYIAFICILVFVSDIGYLNKSRGWLAENVLYYDKAGHFILVGILAFTLNVLFMKTKVKTFYPMLFIGSYLTFVFATIEEFSQIFISSRSFNIYDLIANYLGIAFFSLLFFLMFKKMAASNNRFILKEFLQIKK